MKRLTKWSCMVVVVALSVLSMLFVSACDNGGGSGGNSVAGTTWANGDSRTVFNADGTWAMYKASDGPSQPGWTYTQSGNNVHGEGTNPGVGDFEIDCTISADGKTMVLDFIEHWHNPFKHAVATWTRI